jgi:outer membrane immunogenic protein
MKKTLSVIAAVAALVGTPALAADMSVKAPPLAPAAPVYSWTGCNLNAGVGYGLWDQRHFGETLPGLVQLTDTIDSAGRGWLGQVGAGCDYQINQSWVIGAFGDYNFMNVHGFSDVAGLGGNEKETSAWAAGGRIGYLVTPSLLTYVNGGYTQAKFSQVNLEATGFFPPIPAGLFTPSHTYTGWFLGGGTEYALNFAWLPIRGLFWRNEYRYASYQATDLPILIAATGGQSGNGEHTSQQVQTVTSSLVWRFNWH